MPGAAVCKAAQVLRAAPDPQQMKMLHARLDAAKRTVSSSPRVHVREGSDGPHG